MQLDANDGLHAGHVKSIGQRALEPQQQQQQSSNKHKDVTILCVKNSISWHTGPLSPLVEDVNLAALNALNIPPDGILKENEDARSCITPGLSHVLPPLVRKDISLSNKDE